MSLAISGTAGRNRIQGVSSADDHLPQRPDRHGGQPVPAARVEDVRAAVDHLQAVDYVAAGRIGVLGVCAGGGYAVTAAMTDHAAGSLWHTTELHSRVRSAKKLVVVEGGTHMDFYDVPEYVKRAVEEATPFFEENLAG
ncbi:alpha/beta hydrolase [Amycolatopsis thermoflava]|uniref:alpha/beta hydrolase n=1 Tax=Amycolatopsis thermoflava TaxID=84480 RepID=UPI003F4A69FB